MYGQSYSTGDGKGTLTRGNEMNAEVKFSEWHKGWLGFKNGHTIRTKTNTIKVFATKEEAEKAVAKSRLSAAGIMQRIGRK